MTRKRLFLVGAAGVLLALFAGTALVAASSDLRNSVFGGGGGFSSNAKYSLGSTIGQAGPIGLSASTDGTPPNYQLQAGFWYGAGACNPTNPAGDHDQDNLTTGTEAGLGTDPCLKDTDTDGCSDGEEGVLNPPQFGGDRNPLLDGFGQWDFYDVPVPALKSTATTGTRSRAVAITDVLAIISYSGTSNNGPPNSQGIDYDDDWNANGVEDGVEYDRSASTTPGKPWRSGPPSGGISITDALIAIAQVGHSCSAPP